MDVLPVQLRGVEQRMGRWSSGARPISLSPSPAWSSAPQPARAEEDIGESGAVYTSVFFAGRLQPLSCSPLQAAPTLLYPLSALW